MIVIFQGEVSDLLFPSQIPLNQIKEKQDLKEINLKKKSCKATAFF
jgi:hypothetical protein